MTQKQNIPNLELDLFDFIDILLKRKYVVLMIFGATVMIAVIYCFGLRAEPPAIYEIQMGIRCPDKADIISYEPDNPKQKINIAQKVKSLIEGGMFKGNLQKSLRLETVPDIQIEIHSIPALKIILKHHSEDDGKKILKHIFNLLHSDPIIQTILSKERKLIANEIEKYNVENDILEHKIVQLKEGIKRNDNMQRINQEKLDIFLMNMKENEKVIELIRLLEKQVLHFSMSLTIYNELLNRFVWEAKHNKDEVDNLENKLENINKAFEPEGSIYSALVPIERISNKKIIAMSGVIGLALGVILAFILGVKARRSDTDEV